MLSVNENYRFLKQRIKQGCFKENSLSSHCLRTQWCAHCSLSFFLSVYHLDSRKLQFFSLPFLWFDEGRDKYKIKYENTVFFQTSPSSRLWKTSDPGKGLGQISLQSQTSRDAWAWNPRPCLHTRTSLGMWSSCSWSSASWNQTVIFLAPRQAINNYF